MRSSDSNPITKAKKEVNKAKDDAGSGSVSPLQAKEKEPAGSGSESPNSLSPAGRGRSLSSTSSARVNKGKEKESTDFVGADSNSNSCEFGLGRARSTSTTASRLSITSSGYYSPRSTAPSESFNISTSGPVPLTAPPLRRLANQASFHPSTIEVLEAKDLTPYYKHLDEELERLEDLGFINLHKRPCTIEDAQGTFQKEVVKNQGTEWEKTFTVTENYKLEGAPEYRNYDEFPKRLRDTVVNCNKAKRHNLIQHIVLFVNIHDGKWYQCKYIDLLNPKITVQPELFTQGWCNGYVLKKRISLETGQPYIESTVFWKTTKIHPYLMTEEEKAKMGYVPNPSLAAAEELTKIRRYILGMSPVVAEEMGIVAEEMGRTVEEVRKIQGLIQETSLMTPEEIGMTVEEVRKAEGSIRENIANIEIALANMEETTTCVIGRGEFFIPSQIKEDPTPTVVTSKSGSLGEKIAHMGTALGIDVEQFAADFFGLGIYQRKHRSRNAPWDSYIAWNKEDGGDAGINDALDDFEYEGARGPSQSGTPSLSNTPMGTPSLAKSVSMAALATPPNTPDSLGSSSETVAARVGAPLRITASAEVGTPPNTPDLHAKPVPAGTVEVISTSENIAISAPEKSLPQPDLAAFDKVVSGALKKVPSFSLLTALNDTDSTSSSSSHSRTGSISSSSQQDSSMTSPIQSEPGSGSYSSYYTFFVTPPRNSEQGTSMRPKGSPAGKLPAFNPRVLFDVEESSARKDGRRGSTNGLDRITVDKTENKDVLPPPSVYERRNSANPSELKERLTRWEQKDEKDKEAEMAKKSEIPHVKTPREITRERFERDKEELEARLRRKGFSK